MVEDILIKVGNFIFPVDFIILETEPILNPKGHIPVILGRPFLATANAEINCRNGLMKLSFGNMTIELNIFNLEQESTKHANVSVVQDEIYEPIDISDEEVDLGSSIWPTDEYENLDKILGDNKNGQRWEPPTEPLIEMTKPSPESLKEEAPKLELKPLPEHLKYVYLGPEKTLPVIIASDLDLNQEEELLAVLRENREAIG